MKLSTRSRYGTRIMVDLAQHYGLGAVPAGDIARRQDISVKYLEQLIIPLRRAGFITSIRGAKGGHLLSKSPEEITAGEIVKALEKESVLVKCVEDRSACERVSTCPTRNLWKMAGLALYRQLESVTLAELI